MEGRSMVNDIGFSKLFYLVQISTKLAWFAYNHSEEIFYAFSEGKKT